MNAHHLRSLCSPLRILIVATIGFFILSTVALASATWLSTNGPNWDGTNWVLTGTATISSPHHHVCMNVSIADGPNAGSFTMICSGTSSFTCTIPGSSIGGASSTTWSLFASSSSGCGGNTTVGSPPTGGEIGPTGPNAVNLKSFDVRAISPIERLLNRVFANWRF